MKHGFKAIAALQLLERGNTKLLLFFPLYQLLPVYCALAPLDGLAVALK
jgi:hypothetical protein